ncbi:hypothetical protein NPIL_383901 [Nephila pilipes]|uniref:Uncharacterized protein n=1 Tax=Nephila pilipes TaxID=299642 RepID=A0A8X6I8G7_NEPPI|nr:hypothetical protein NPIL_383901 [Nephila pilipes]
MKCILDAYVFFCANNNEIIQYRESETPKIFKKANSESFRMLKYSHHRAIEHINHRRQSTAIYSKDPSTLPLIIPTVNSAKQSTKSRRHHPQGVGTVKHKAGH